MAAYGLPDCLRLSVGLENENRAAIKALEEFLA
jgi:histidinol-phosphate/aromatic aminotransferase/cobyric acid decarboxylase-like protein